MLDLLILLKEMMPLVKVFMLITLSTSRCLSFCLVLWYNSEQEPLYPSCLPHSTHTQNVNIVNEKRLVSKYQR